MVGECDGWGCGGEGWCLRVTGGGVVVMVEGDGWRCSGVVIVEGDCWGCSVVVMVEGNGYVGVWWCGDG